MFKSRIPLQTPPLIKLVLFAILVTFFVGWSFSNEASSVESQTETQTVAIAEENRESSNLARLAHQQVNKYRNSLNLVPLEFNGLISEQAKIHSVNMAQETVKFSHDGFQDRVGILENKISYSGAAENIAYNMGYQDPVGAAVKGWIDSESHRQNMEGNYNLTGIGVAVNPQGKYYFTQIFILEN